MNTSYKIIIAALVWSVCSLATAQSASEEFDPAEVPNTEVPQGSPPIWAGPENVLFDNGPLTTSVGTGAGGADESILENITLGMTSLGAAHQTTTDFVVADDFTVPAGGWFVDEIVFFAYQTGSPTTSTITEYRVQIWDGRPDDPASTVVFGDPVSNVLVDTAFSNIYRLAESSPGATNRPIMANTVAVGQVLAPGSYFISWDAGGTLASGPWAPPVTIPGELITGDALQSGDAGVTFAPIVDGGQPATTALGLPFIIQGTPNLPESQPVPVLGMNGLIIMILALMATAVVVLRRS